MNKLTSNFMRVGLLSSLCFGIALSACTCTRTVGFEPDGAYYVQNVAIYDVENENNGSFYYTTYKKEHLYDFSQFTFNNEEKTVVVSKSYDDTQAIKGTYAYTPGRWEDNLFLEGDTKTVPSKLTITLENGDVFEGRTVEGGMWAGKPYILLSGNGISMQLELGENPYDYFAEFYESSPKDMGKLIFGEAILKDMNEYEDNRYPQAFRDFYQSFLDRERLFIYPDVVYSNGNYYATLSVKDERGLPSFQFRFREGLTYFIRVTYLPESLDEIDADWVEKYKDGGQVWNETRTEVSFVYEYQDPHFAYGETLFVEISSPAANEPITEGFVNGLKFTALAGDNTIYDCFTQEKIEALDAVYEPLKDPDNKYNGEKIDGYEILEDIIYMQPTKGGGETKRIYRLLEDDSVIAVVNSNFQGLFYYDGKFYTFDGYREISLFYLHFYA